jgi:hypothetical protein
MTQGPPSETFLTVRPCHTEQPARPFVAQGVYSRSSFTGWSVVIRHTLPAWMRTAWQGPNATYGCRACGRVCGAYGVCGVEVRGEGADHEQRFDMGTRHS